MAFTIKHHFSTLCLYSSISLCVLHLCLRCFSHHAWFVSYYLLEDLYCCHFSVGAAKFEFGILVSTSFAVTFPRRALLGLLVFFYCRHELWFRLSLLASLKNMLAAENARLCTAVDLRAKFINCSTDVREWFEDDPLYLTIGISKIARAK